MAGAVDLKSDLAIGPDRRHGSVDHHFTDFENALCPRASTSNNWIRSRNLLEPLTLGRRGGDIMRRFPS